MMATRRPIGKIPAKLARFRLYRHRSLRVNTRFAAFFKIYQIISLKSLKFGKIIVPLIPKDMFRLVCLVKLVFFAREGVAF